jgi:hypothetical protein
MSWRGGRPRDVLKTIGEGIQTVGEWVEDTELVDPYRTHPLSEGDFDWRR